jgi:cellulose biosynthesis protein BcsQ
MNMKIISLFNNKGGVGKSTLSYHLGCALGELGKKVLFVDLDPQCNLTINAMFEDELEQIWKDEDPFMDDFSDAIEKDKERKILTTPRSVHFLLKPVEDGFSDFEALPPAKELSANMFILPGRLSINKFEAKISERWNGLYQGESLSIRTVTAFRTLCEKYAEKYSCDYVIVDTSPSLGIMNKTIISTVDGFFIPTFPDMFSLYGIKNIGNSLELWQKEFNTIYNLISTNKIAKFPKKFVQFIGFTIYNAKPYNANKNPNPYNLASAHYRYALLIPQTIRENIRAENIANIPDESIQKPIGGLSVMYTHNTYPSVAQGLKCPMWLVPEVYSKMKDDRPEYLEENQIQVNNGLFGNYRDTLEMYKTFAMDFIERAEVL